MKLVPHLLVLGAVIVAGAAPARSQTPSKATINPPPWILAAWTNTLESNLNRTEGVTFTTHEIQLEKGFLERRKVVNLSSRFKDYQVKESVEGKAYRLEFLRDNEVFVYEFRLNNLGQGFHGQEALTYSITRNNKVVVQRSPLLFKPIPGN